MVPQWLALLVAALVILFGIYRLWLAFAGPSDEARAEERRGLMAVPRRHHGAIGIIFLLVGGALIATSFGWNPFHRDEAARPDNEIELTPIRKGSGSGIPIQP